ncbi:PhzF family phenazine biosynthesis isomerase [Bacillus velezensis]|nr:PhzF family phenazine biosynthesis isomerase [Bacillus velezensis]
MKRKADQTYQIETKPAFFPQKPLNETPGIHHTRTGSPQFLPFTGDKEKLAASLGITAEDFHSGSLIVYGSTGIWTLIVPLRSLKASRNMVPDNAQFPAILRDLPKASVHPFSLETVHPESDLHGRHFSSLSPERPKIPSREPLQASWRLYAAIRRLRSRMPHD